MIRVTGGDLKGRRLLTAPGRDVRPAMGRLRLTLFDVLGDVSGARALDLFAGSGAIGIEALSRGAAHCTFVDLDTTTVERNVEALGLGPRSRVVRGDALAVEGTFDLIFVDPPYALYEAPEPLVALLRRLSPGARVAIEHTGRDDVVKRLDFIRFGKTRRFGRTLLEIGRGPFSV